MGFYIAFFIQGLAYIRQCGQKWLVILLKIAFNFRYQSEEEAGSAGEQPASNKIDAITIKKGVDLFQLLCFYRVAT